MHNPALMLKKILKNILKKIVRRPPTMKKYFNKILVKSVPVIIALFVLLPAAACTGKAQKQAFAYPVTPTCDQVDDYFGTKVKDPYRWLENENDEKVKKWIEEQNKVTAAYLSRIPYREKIFRRLLEVYNYPRYTSPTRVGKYYFFSRNDGLQDQSVIYIQAGLTGKPEVFLDPNKLSKDGTVSARLADASKDDRYIAYTRSEAGSDWREIHIMEVETKKELPDVIRWMKFSGVAWFGAGFFYARYNEPEKGKELTAENTFQKIYYHRLGDPQEKDTLIYEDPIHPKRYYSPYVTEDQKYLILNSSEGTYGNEIYVKDLAKKEAKFIPLIPGFANNNNVIENSGDKFITLTDCGAPQGKLVLIDAKNPAKEKWQTIIPEKPEVIEEVRSVGGKLFVHYLKDAYSHIYRHNLNGELETEISLPTLGSVYGFAGKKEDNFLFYIFNSYTYPPTIYKYDIAANKSKVFRESEIKFDPADYETGQVFYKSKDGTRIPMFIVHRKNLVLDGSHPLYLHGYGGFNSSSTPDFETSLIILLENGVIYAEANIRGGSEYGEEWHKAGMLLKKQNVFDDFIAAAEYLIREKYTTKDKLAIAGASNGGLLVGACMTQRPDLFKVAFPAVGVMDMLRYHKFTVGWSWVVEYGASDKEEYFKNLYAYSPLHNIKEGTAYPATLVTTADHDDRVIPAHSYKFIATLQAEHKGENPVLIRVYPRSGHGSSNLTRAIEKHADTWAFMFANMGIKPIY